MAKKIEEALTITSFEDLQSYSQGEITALPGFSANQPLVVRMRKPDLISMVADGVVPNVVLKAAMELFGEDTKPSDIFDNTDFFKDLLSIGNSIAKACFIEPTYEDLESSGMKLTFEQAQFLFSLSQQETNKLATFR